ncbi:hypothetical protein [Akkermansia sp.]|uniref:hypothetical protein n=1 Tax=Akkermansia sp. TaxID=1872421 RepID=UPI0025BC2F0A|nr:hypothetical protein [Akkermansia sp.]MCC8149212.1 hypothetical protein [Akkermansia sp.]
MRRSFSGLWNFVRIRNSLVFFIVNGGKTLQLGDMNAAGTGKCIPANEAVFPTWYLFTENKKTPVFYAFPSAGGGKRKRPFFPDKERIRRG